MATGKSLHELADEIERQYKVRNDYTAPTPGLELVTTEDANRVALKIGDIETLPIKPLAHEQIGDRIGVPKKYYDRMLAEAPALLATNVNHWFQNEPEVRRVRTLDGQVRAFLSDRYRALDNFELLHAILPLIAELQISRGLSVESCEVTDTRMYLKLVDESIVQEFMPNAPASAHVWSTRKPIVAGVVIQNSEVGRGSLAIQPSILVKACSNRAVFWDYGMKKNHVGRGTDVALEDAITLYQDDTRKADDVAFFLKVRDVVRHVLSEEVFGKMIERATVAAERKIENDIPKTIEVVAKKFALTDGDRSGVLTRLIEYGDLSQWGVAQAVTRHAQDVANYDVASELEKVGGEIITLPASAWKEINRAAA